MANEFNSHSYGPFFATLLNVDRRRPLDGTVRNGGTAGHGDTVARFADLSLDNAFGHATVADRDAALCCLSGCWLLVDDLDSSHRLSQSINSPAGSWWHGIMHRREGDFSNSKYWMRQADWPPATDALAKRFGGWDAIAFVDRCQHALQSGDATAIEACLDRQQAEWEVLFDACYQAAIGQA